MSEFKLIKEIIALSESNFWDKAKTEWALLEIYEAEEPNTCLCGKHPIIEICLLKNKINNKLAIVGNSCVNKFMGLASNPIFHAIKRIKKDTKKSLNSETIQYARDKDWINQWEIDFLINIGSKRKLSANQISKKVAINEKILRFIKKK